LASSVAAGATAITLKQAVDWKIGEVIAIASTDWNHLHSEVFAITAVSSD